MSNKFDILVKKHTQNKKIKNNKEQGLLNNNTQTKKSKNNKQKELLKVPNNGTHIHKTTDTLHKDIEEHKLLDMNIFGKTKLNTPWTLYYHSGAPDDWSNESYTNINNFMKKQITTVEEYYNIVHRLHLLNCSNVINFYLFRHNRHPMYESEQNAFAISWTARANIDTGFEKWIKLCDNIVVENTLKTIDNVDLNGTINGISITYKQTHYIIRITISDKKINNSALINQNIIDIIKPSTIQWQPIIRDKK